jgi:tRNA-dihydrouridine synthase A
VKTNAEIAEHLLHVDGVMLGREAYHNPWLMADWDAHFFGAEPQALTTRASVEAAMVAYMASVTARGEPWSHVSRHMLGLRHGQPGARHWRQVWSDHHHKATPPERVSQIANTWAPNTEPA